VLTAKRPLGVVMLMEGGLKGYWGGKTCLWRGVVQVEVEGVVWQCGTPALALPEPPKSTHPTNTPACRGTLPPQSRCPLLPPAHSATPAGCRTAGAPGCAARAPVQAGWRGARWGSAHSILPRQHASDTHPQQALVLLLQPRDAALLRRRHDGLLLRVERVGWCAVRGVLLWRCVRCGVCGARCSCCCAVLMQGVC
jgi:hypothetical protein